METIAPRKAGDNRKYPTDDDADRIERIVALFAFAMIVEEKYTAAICELSGRTGKYAAVDAVVKRLQAVAPPNIDRVEIRARIWRDLIWHDDLRNIPVKGTA